MTARSITICIAIVGMLLTCWPLACQAATVIAAVMSNDSARYREAHRALVKSLAARGYTSPPVEFVMQTPTAPDPPSVSLAVKKLNAVRPSLIIAYGAPAALTATRETEGIPVVSVDIYSAEKPLAGMCGASSRVPLVTLIKTLLEIRPYRRLGVLYNSREAGSMRQFDDLRKAAAQHGMVVNEANAATPEALDHLLPSLLDRSDVVVATESSVVERHLEKLIQRSKTRNIPVIAVLPDASERGAMISLEVNPQEQGHLAADIATRILEGARPDHLPLLSPRRVALVINLRTAREMGISIPFAVLSSATRIIK